MGRNHKSQTAKRQRKFHCGGKLQNPAIFVAQKKHLLPSAPYSFVTLLLFGP
jgi:hypothetical protein